MLSLFLVNILAIPSVKRPLLFLLILSVFAFPSFALEVTIVGNQSMPFNGIKEVTIEGTKRSQPEGMTFEILQAATKHGAPRFQFELGIPWNKAQHLVQTAGKKLVAIVPLTRTQEREEKYSWLAPLFTHQPRFSFVNRPDPFTIQRVSKLDVGVIKSSALIPALKQSGVANLMLNSSAFINAKLLRNNRIQAVAESQYVDTYYWLQAGYKVKDLQFMPFGDPKTIYIAGNKDFPDEVSRQ